jgi:hypothetical protein
MTDDDHSNPATDFDTWRASFRAHFPGEYSLKKDPNDLFSGSVRTRSVSGLTAVEVRGGNHSYERTPRDIRRDEVDIFVLAILVSGHPTLSQNDREIKYVPGDCTLINTRRPFSYAVGEKQLFQSVNLLVPWRLLTSTIGFEPLGAVSGRSDTLAVRLLSRLILDAHDSDPGGAAATHHMHATCYLRPSWCTDGLQ